MRKLLILGLLICSSSLFAQSKADSTALLKDPFYLQLYLGVNKSANENLPWTEFSSYPWSGGLFISAGQEFNKLWGWRVALRFNHNKSRNVQACESKDTWGWNNTGLFADVTFDVSDLLRNKLIAKRPLFNLKAFAGVGMAYTYHFDQVPLSYTHPYSRSSRLLPAVRTGLTASFKLTDNWRIGTELSHTLFEDHFNGVAYNTPLDSRTNLKVGVTYLFAKKVRTKRSVLRLNRLRECPLLPLIIPDPEDIKIRQIEGHAFLDFPVNETVIYPNYRKNPEELARIHHSVDSAQFDRSIVIKRISLHGYASPESPYSNNIRLAKGRTEELKQHLISKYHFDSSVFSTEYTPEDWGNLRSFLQENRERKVKDSYWYDNPAYTEMPETPDYVINNRDELIRVIDMDMDPDAKEEVLKKVGGGEPYRWLLKHVYPGLRHTDYIIEYEVKAYPVKDGRKLIYTHPEALSMNEMFLVAQSYEEGADGWRDALLIAAHQYPDDETANLNAACACVKTYRLVDAKKYLKKAGNSQQAKYVNDVIRAMEGSVKWKLENGRVIVFEENE
ncbi:MAG: hypothetical protein J5486_01245 [Bacteroidaceae bacterium]|nr:hypothetical protein [Bacteroidaceae bacterium]